MRRILISIFGVFMIFSAFGVGENIPTSKSNVDAEIAIKQDKISANNGAAQVLTNTGTAGEYGTKGIYDSTASYATQTDALIDAVTMNTAVQNAIDSEFQCVEYNPNDPNDCWLMDVRGETVTGQKTLPTGYTALEYIQGDKHAYIDTLIVLNNDTSAEAKFQFPNVEGATTGNFIMGSRVSMTSRAFTLVGFSGGSRWASNYGTKAAEFGSADTNIHIMKRDKDKVYMDDILQLTTTVTDFTTPGTAYIFSVNQKGSSYLTSNIKLWYLKIWDNDILVRNFIPARRDSDSEIGMYDMVSGTFFTNAGSGDFIAGPVVNLYLPSGN